MPDQLDWLIEALLREMPEYRAQTAKWGNEDRFGLFRALVNVRPPWEASPAFLAHQDAFLKGYIAQKGITDANSLSFDSEGLCVWRGDVTTLRCDAIVNAANSALLGCFCPNHGCIDNAIHTFAGVQLRLACAELMRAQGHEEPLGQAKITPAFNLPSRYVLHTVGPIVQGATTKTDCQALASCYRSCLELAARNHLKSIAFCCISTGEFHFPNEQAAQIALQTVRAWKAQACAEIEVIFNVFKQADETRYRALLG